MRRYVMLLAMWVCCGLAGAAGAAEEAADEFFPGISSYETSYFGWATLGEGRAQFQVSLKYPFLPFEALGADPAAEFIGLRSGLYAAYTGRYDFFLQRYSAPVVSRNQNPGLFFQFNRCWNEPLILTLGYFHESDGQVVDTLEKYRAIPEHAQDFVSRGWDYVQAGASYTWGLPELDAFFRDKIFVFSDSWLGTIFSWDPQADQTHLTAALQSMTFLNKQGFGTSWKEEGVFWTPVDHQPRRSDYDGIRLKLMLENGHFRIAETVRSGYTAFNFSSDFSISFRIRKWLPIALHYYCGYGPDLVTYQTYAQSLIVSFDLYDYPAH